MIGKGLPVRAKMAQAKCTLRRALPIIILFGLWLGVTTRMTADSAPSLQNIQVNMLAGGKVKVDMTFSQPVAAPKGFVTEEPPRIVLDFNNVQNSMKQGKQTVGLGSLQSYQVFQVQDRMRMLFDLKEGADYAMESKGQHLIMLIAGQSTIADQMTQQQFAANPWAKTSHAVKGVDFHHDAKNDGGRVVVTLSDAGMGINVSRQGQDIVVDFISTSIPNQLIRSLKVTDFGTPVQVIESLRRGGNVRLIIHTAGSFQQLAYQVNKQFIVDVTPASTNSGVLARPEDVQYTGEKLSLNFQDIQVRAVLQLLAEFTGINIVASDSVKGNMTLRLNNVPWDEALAIILRTQGLAQRKVGNVVMIAPTEEVAAQEKQELEARKEVKELEPLLTEMMQLNYAKASDIAKLLKEQSPASGQSKGESSSLLSSRGSVSVDERTNTVLIKDVPAVLQEVRALIEKLDVAVKQVLIETRIVQIDVNAELDIGVRWGISRSEHISGTLQGANEINQNVIQGNNPLLAVPVADRLNVDLPTTPTAGIPASIGVAVARLGKGYLLDLEISALESEGSGQVIASPRLVTANQQEAYIEQGEQIPYQQSTSSGATSVQFINAVLGLRVTPQITPDGKVIMQLKINQDQRSNEPLVNGTPTINTKQIQTQVLVDNGETIVLGGIYSETINHTVLRVPFLGALPIIGYLFKTTQDTSARTELLIFITPKVIQQLPILD